MVWRLDRLSRSFKELIARAKALRNQSVGLQSLKEPIDTESGSGWLIFHIFGALAEFERTRSSASGPKRVCRSTDTVRSGPPGWAPQTTRCLPARSRGGAVSVTPAHGQGDLRTDGYRYLAGDPLRLCGGVR